MPRDRPRLWESFRRALGSPAPSNEPEPDSATPPVGYAPPFLPADEPAEVPPTAAAAPLRPAPLDPSPPAALPSGAELNEPLVTASADDRSTLTAVPAADDGAPGSPRLARGLASFSRDNADREKKFRHILSDGEPRGKKQ